MISKNMFNERTFKLLSCIVENPGITSIKIGRIMKINCSSALVSVNKFEMLGLIKRVKDGRSKPIFVTEKGKEMFKSLSVINNSWK